MKIEKLSKPLYKTREERDIKVRVRDGVALCLDVFRPDVENERFPALLAVGGYGKDVQSIKVPPQPIESWIFDHNVEAGDIEFFVSRGYAYVIPDPRGIGKSEGVFYGIYNKLDQQDCYDIIEWTAKQPWCNGNVGMVGISWFGTIQRLVAALQPPHLKAIFPIEASDDLYRHTHHGGILRTHHFAIIADAAINNPKPESEELYTKEELERKIKERLEDPDIKNNSYFHRILSSYCRAYSTCIDYLLHPTDGPFWKERSAYTKLDKIRIPVYEGGFWGTYRFIIGSFNCYNALNVPKKLGVFMKGRDVRLPVFPELNQETLRWYDHWLKGIDTGIMDEPPVKIFVVGINRLRYEKEWPLARTNWTRFYLRRFGGLATEPEEGEDIQPDAFAYKAPTISTEVQELRYSTRPLTEPVEVTGPIALYLHASIDQDDANFVVELRDVLPTGEKIPVSMGYLKASHRALDERKSKPWQPYHTHENPEPVEPGKICEYAIEMEPTSNVFLPNHRVELRISSTYPLPQVYHHKLGSMGFLHSSRTTCFRIYADRKNPSHLLLPIIPESPQGSYAD